MKKTLLFISLMASGLLQANNLQIAGIAAPNASTVTFTITWDNSWNTAGGNWDAVWVFVKTQPCLTPAPSPWDHANLAPTGHTVTGGGTALQIDVVTDNKGVFIRRNAATFGSGNIGAAATITLTLATPVLSVANTNYNVVGIEMVYIPSGSFSVGDGSTVANSGVFGTNGTNATNIITSEALLTSGFLSNSSTYAFQGSSLAAAFPKGFAAFYCMKYEISQEQYVTFLNMLSYDQQEDRSGVLPNSAAGTLILGSGGNYRNKLKIITPGVPINVPAVYGNDYNNNGVYNEATDGQNIACNFLSWDDMLAYLDWSALRPMTELEYEKICRGPIVSVFGEYAWGSTGITLTDAGTATNPGADNELPVATGNGLCNIASANIVTNGPLRCGYAAAAATTRLTAGAAFYGVMDMAGNLWEQTQAVHLDNSTASNPFTGVLGDGFLTSSLNGNANAVNWGAGSPDRGICRGGNWLSTSVHGNISYRAHNFATADLANPGQGRVNTSGGRGVRQF